MATRNFSSGRIRRADYDATSRQLDLHWDDKRVLAYRPVPEEVFRRLCNAPYPASYWEDRIAEEYPTVTPMKPPAADVPARSLKDLFGDLDVPADGMPDGPL